MKKRYIAFVGFMFLALVLLAPAVARAQETTLEQRLEQYKIERKIDTKNKEEKLRLKCGIAQANLRVLQAKVVQVKSTRTTAYTNIDDILTNLETSLDEQAFETSTLNSVIKTYQEKVTEYNNNMNTYKQALDDAVTVDCAADPHGFKGALETARLYHDKMVPIITDIRTYLTNTVKTTLLQIKEQLASGRTTGGGQ